MTEWERYPLTDLERFDQHVREADPVQWEGREALRLDGLLLLKDRWVQEGTLEVDLWCTGPAYPGLVFHAQDEEAFELVYVQPHTSGQWDAIQYDPVFGGSNTWQIHQGPACQAEAEIPVGRWLTLRAAFSGGQMAVWVWPSGQPLPDGASPHLTVSRLAHGSATGRIGLWTYRPVYFSELRLGAPSALEVEPRQAPPVPGLLTDWHLEGIGPVRCQENGVLNLNRYLSAANQPEAVLTRELVVPPSMEVHLRFGFSDALQLLVDDQSVFEGSCRFTGFSDREARGYIELGSHRVHLTLAPGIHRLTARLRVEEPFGWGLIMAIT